MKPILWLSRHPALPAQQEELKRLGRWPIIYDNNSFIDSDDIVRRFQESGAADIVIVAPQSLIAKLLKKGLRPLWTIMDPVTSEYADAHPECCVTMTGSDTARETRHMAKRPARSLRFMGFRRLTGIELKFEDVEPVA